MSTSVKLHVYDLSHGLARIYAPQLGLDIDGVWHSGVVVHNREIWYGNGVLVSETPGATHLGVPHRVIDLGTTEVPWELVQTYIAEQEEEQFRADKYDLLQNNCNHFADEFSQFLTGGRVPSYIVDTATKVAATPLGQMLASQFNGAAPV